MTLAIETEKLTKAYGRKARGIEDVDLAVEEGEVFGFLGPYGRPWIDLRPGYQKRQCGDKGKGRQPARGVRPGGQDDRRGPSQVLRQVARRGRPSLRARDLREARGRVTPSDAQAIAGEQAEDRARAGHVPQAAFVDARRAH